MEGLIEGRIVHYVPVTGGDHAPALIVRVVDRDPVRVNLCVFASSSWEAMQKWAMCHYDGVPYSDEKGPGTWHWIERA